MGDPFKDRGNPVGISTVRALYGVKGDEKASKAILATTTSFTRDAKKSSENHEWELELRDSRHIVVWIEDYQELKHP
jgi:restriction endonuclease Mrr